MEMEEAGYMEAHDIIFIKVGPDLPILPHTDQSDLTSFSTVPNQSLAVSNLFGLTFFSHPSGFDVTKTCDLIELVQASMKNEKKATCAKDTSLVHVPMKDIHALELTRTELTLVACAANNAYFFDVPTLIHQKDTKPFWSILIGDGASIKNLIWNPSKEGSFLVLSSKGELSFGKLEGNLKAISGGVIGVDWSPDGLDIVYVMQDGDIHFIKADLSPINSIHLPSEMFCEDKEENTKVLVDTVRWVRQDSILFSCVHIDSDGSENDCSLFVLRLDKDNAAKGEGKMLSFPGLFPSIDPDILATGSGPHMLTRYLDLWEIAVGTCRRSTDDHIAVIGWMKDENDQVCNLDLADEKYRPRIELQASGDDNIVVGLAIDQTTSSVRFPVPGDDSGAKLPPSPLLLCTTLEMKICCFSISRKDKRWHDVPMVFATENLPEAIKKPLDIINEDESKNIEIQKKLEFDQSTSLLPSPLSSNNSNSSSTLTEVSLLGSKDVSKNSVEMGSQNLPPLQVTQSLGFQGTKKSLEASDASKHIKEPGSQNDTQRVLQPSFSTGMPITSPSVSFTSNIENNKATNPLPGSSSLFPGLLQQTDRKQKSDSTPAILASNTSSSIFPVNDSTKLETSRQSPHSLAKENSANKLNAAFPPKLMVTGASGTIGGPTFQPSTLMKDNVFRPPSGLRGSTTQQTPSISHAVVAPHPSYASEMEADFVLELEKVRNLASEVDDLMACIEGTKSQTTGEAKTFTKSLLIDIEQRTHNLLNECRSFMDCVRKRKLDAEDLRDECMRVDAWRIYMQSLFEQVTDSHYQELWNKQRLQPEMEVKGHHIFRADQVLKQQIAELEGHLHELELGSGANSFNRQKKWNGSEKNLGKVKSLQNLYSTVNAQITIAEQLSDQVSQQLELLRISSSVDEPTLLLSNSSHRSGSFKDDSKKAIYQSSFETPKVVHRSDMPLSQRILSTYDMQTPRNSYPLGGMAGSESTRRRRESLDKSWVGIGAGKTTVKRSVQVRYTDAKQTPNTSQTSKVIMSDKIRQTRDNAQQGLTSNRRRVEISQKTSSHKLYTQTSSEQFPEMQDKIPGELSRTISSGSVCFPSSGQKGSANMFSISSTQSHIPMTTTPTSIVKHALPSSLATPGKTRQQPGVRILNSGQTAAETTNIQNSREQTANTGTSAVNWGGSADLSTTGGLSGFRASTGSSASSSIPPTATFGNSSGLFASTIASSQTSSIGMPGSASPRPTFMPASKAGSSTPTSPFGIKGSTVTNETNAGSRSPPTPTSSFAIKGSTVANESNAGSTSSFKESQIPSTGLLGSASTNPDFMSASKAGSLTSTNPFGIKASTAGSETNAGLTSAFKANLHMPSTMPFGSTSTSPGIMSTSNAGSLSLESPFERKHSTAASETGAGSSSAFTAIPSSASSNNTNPNTTSSGRSATGGFLATTTASGSSVSISGGLTATPTSAGQASSGSSIFSKPTTGGLTPNPTSAGQANSGSSIFSKPTAGDLTLNPSSAGQASSGSSIFSKPTTGDLTLNPTSAGQSSSGSSIFSKPTTGGLTLNPPGAGQASSASSIFSLSSTGPAFGSATTAGGFSSTATGFAGVGKGSSSLSSSSPFASIVSSNSGGSSVSSVTPFGNLASGSTGGGFGGSTAGSLTSQSLMAPAAASNEEDMEEEASGSTELTFSGFGGFGLGTPTSSPGFQKANPFGVSSGLQTSSSPSIAAPPGQLFRPASFSLPVVQSSPQQTSPNPNPNANANVFGFGSGSPSFGSGSPGFGTPSQPTASAFGQPAQPGIGQQALGSALGAFGQTRQIGSGLGSMFGNITPTIGAGFAQSATSSGFANAATGGGFAAAATGGGFAAAATGGGFASVAPSGGFASAAPSGGFASAATSTGGFGGFLAAGGGGFGGSGFGGVAPGGVNAGVFGALPKVANGDTNLFTQMRK